MTHTILLSGTEIEYTVRMHPRARRTKLTIYPDGRVVATIPRFATEKAAIRLLKEKETWVLKGVSVLSSGTKYILPYFSKKEAAMMSVQTRMYIQHRLKYFNEYYGFIYNKFFVKDMKSQWGSCSHKKNLNYNFRLLLLPEELADSLIVHELCHLQEMNHSKKFWDLVSMTITDYRKKERELHQYLIR